MIKKKIKEIIKTVLPQKYYNAAAMYYSFLKSKLGHSKVKKVFFVLSTGRCGTCFLSNILNLANNATVLHRPLPGLESINPAAYELFIKNRDKFNNIRVNDFPLAARHALIYKGVDTEIFGDCYNSIYPFAIAFFYFFAERKIDVKFIHLVRHPYECCESIFVSERPESREGSANFSVRADLLKKASSPAEIACDVWTGINEVIKYEINYLEKLKPGMTRLVRMEDMSNLDNVIDLYKWLGLNIPDIDDILRVIQNKSDRIRNPHRLPLYDRGDARITEEEQSIIKRKIYPYLKLYGYS